MNLYNEIDPFACDWLENLIAQGRIAPGRVERRSIKELDPNDIPSQAHFFAGIGVWSRALRDAGFPDDFPVWTGSCPCQPWSSAGRGQGFDDERHLWPDWFKLIKAKRPLLVVGEQVASKDGLAWLDAVQADMEGAGYAFRAVDLCAAGVGAPHIRQRLYFAAVRLADDDGAGRAQLRRLRVLDREWASLGHDFDGRGAAGGLAHNGVPRTGRSRCERREGRRRRRSEGMDERPLHGGSCGARGLGNTLRARLEGHTGHVDAGNQPGRLGTNAAGPAPTSGVWGGVEWLPCRDGKLRPAQPGVFPLAHGASQRVGRLRAYGNAIVLPLATEFLRAVKGCLIEHLTA